MCLILQLKTHMFVIVRRTTGRIVSTQRSIEREVVIDVLCKPKRDNCYEKCVDS